MQTYFMLVNAPLFRLRFACALARVCTAFAAGSAIAVPLAQAQTQEQSATYISQIDEDLTIRRVAVLPVVDNVDGIYARPIEAEVINLVKASHRWDFVESDIAGAIPSAIELEENPSEVQRITKSVDADAFIMAAASRGPTGLSLRLNLFLKRDGKLLAQEVLKDHQRFELPEIKSRTGELYKKMVSKLPYDGLLLSRQANRVTINLGKSDGLAKDQVVTVLQIISANRHPKFNFIISTEKEILGRIKILKVDETLSFGSIISEKEKGVIRRLAKISGLDPVNYPEPTSLGDGSGLDDLNARPDAAVTLGKDPKEWLPVKPATFGQVGIKAGFGQYQSSINLGTAGTFEAKSQLYPSLGINGEIWITPEWTMRAEMTQGVISTPNPRSNSSPSTLNHALSRYSLEAMYNFLLRDDFFGPKVFLSTGLGSYRMFVDDSTPRGLTTVNYTGVIIGLGGSFPVTDEKEWYAGGRLNLFVMTGMNESPVTSGSSPTNTINEFSLYGEKKIAENLRATAGVDFSLYSTSFSGAGNRTANGTPEVATSLSQRHTTFNAGINYMF